MKLKTDCEIILFLSSSGHCPLDCRYCIAAPVVKNQPSLDYGDILFVLKTLGNRKTFLSFSGMGDFFAGYSRPKRMLDHLLEHDVEVALDINGIFIHEFSELIPEKLEKIRYINLTMHYHQIVEKRLTQTWANHARQLIHLRQDAIWPDYIASPALEHEWEDAIRFYQTEVFEDTGKPVLLVRDISQPFTMAQESHLEKLAATFPDVLAGMHKQDFAAIFGERVPVLCPAGRRYFRIWNDGRIQGCPNLPDVVTLKDCGNAKNRKMIIQTEDFRCFSPRFCDCHVIEALNKMNYIDSSR